jgi:hypothetical protein
VRRGLVILALLAVILMIAGAVLFSTSSTGHRGTSADAGASPATPTSPAPTRTAPVNALSTPLFSTSYEPGWTLTSKFAPHGIARRQISSTGAPIDGLGLPPAGAVGITIDEDPLSGIVDGRFITLAGRNALGLLRLTVGTPRGAEELTRASAPRQTTLGGVEAAEEAYTYSYEGRQNTQVDIISKHHGRSVLVELDAEPTLSRQSQAALELLVANWRWT